MKPEDRSQNAENRSQPRKRSGGSQSAPKAFGGKPVRPESFRGEASQRSVFSPQSSLLRPSLRSGFAEQAVLSPQSSFTLIEMLVVIAIIVVLAGLLFPVINGARRKAKEAKARVQIQQIATAFRAYYNEYAVWPAKDMDGSPNVAASTGGVLWAAIFTGNETNNNPRKLVFMEFKAGETNSAGILDPWDQGYSFGFDTNYNNSVDVLGLGTGLASDTNGVNLNTSFLIWSTGDPKKRTVIPSWK